eukprot:GFUD01047856.1.p1 GENE.GFUD01047856.1~~GFUD01047856.1.p1  ORF type:complete len:218 (+),score=65.55 GFUD01047856.1:59-655(+)
MEGLFVLFCLLFHHSAAIMVMDETSCVEVEERICGTCHTIYMEECRMKMVEEMMPVKVSMCKNVTRFERICKIVMNYKMVEEKHPICKMEMMDKSHTFCQEKLGSAVARSEDPCKHVMKCEIGMKKMKKQYPKIVCEKVAIGEEEKCVDMVKLKKKKHEANYCSFIPKTVCHQDEVNECRMVRRKMCNYQDRLAQKNS